jgi:ubiquinone/menaquinone biosynthesis C-methylase UbiE
VFLRRCPSGPNRERGEGVSPEAVAAPATVSGEPSANCHWETGKAAQRRRPASQETCRRPQSQADTSGGVPRWSLERRSQAARYRLGSVVTSEVATGFQMPDFLPLARGESPGRSAEADGGNYSLKEEIRAYWSKRAATFDLSWGHGIRTEDELAAWSSIFARHGAIEAGSRVLELASGTGEVTRALVRIGCRIDAIDLCEPMIARARAKHPEGNVRFHLGDAEYTMMPDSTYDAVVSRHLVWTLVDPAAALADWFRVLRPGGRLVIVDGDWVTSTVKARFFRRLSALIDRMENTGPLWDQAAHERIISQVRFSDGLRTDALAPMIDAAGFTDLLVGSLSDVRRYQWRSATWSERLRLLATYDSKAFVISASKPAA